MFNRRETITAVGAASLSICLPTTSIAEADYYYDWLNQKTNDPLGMRPCNGRSIPIVRCNNEDMSDLLIQYLQTGKNGYIKHLAVINNKIVEDYSDLENVCAKTITTKGSCSISFEQGKIPRTEDLYAKNDLLNTHTKQELNTLGYHKCNWGWTYCDKEFAETYKYTSVWIHKNKSTIT